MRTSLRISLISIISFLLINYNCLGQNKILIAEGKSPSLYFTHIVAPKENFYSIGRLYNVSPKEIAPYNNLSLNKGLNVGQIIKIPLNKNNFYQEVSANGNTMVPVYHVMEEKEGLYHVSEEYNKVSTEMLKKWNNLQSDVVNNGTKLIVGYLKTDKDHFESISGNNKINNSNLVTLKDDASEVKPKPDKDLPKDEMINNNNNDKKVNPVNNPDISVIKETQQIPEESPGNKDGDFKGGIFRNLYEDQSRKKISVNENGTVGVFKSTSGWQDGKYYCFHNSAVPGTIIKITNNLNGKSVYAKVLDLIPDIKQNSGLTLNLSNSAAEQLGETENKFDCSFSYSK